MSLTPIPKKSMGQHWLDDKTSLEAMIVAAQVGSYDTVLEIGPGLGSLTRLLVTAAARVVAVEFDRDLAKGLAKRVPADNLDVVSRNILQFDFTELPPGYLLVANIPYYLTSNLVRVISESTNPPQRAALLMQKEVAQRLAAPAGSMSLLSVTAQFYWQVSLGDIVPAMLFTPPPKVDSQIVSLMLRKAVLFPDVEPKLFFQIVKAGFSQKRKTLLNALSSGLHVEKPAMAALLERAAIDPRLRPQNLTMEQWYTIYSFHRVGL